MQKRRRQPSCKRWTLTLRSRIEKNKRYQKECRSGYLFLLPSLLGTGGFVLLPFLDVFRRSFVRAVGNGFVGMENYRQVLENKAFRLAAVNTVRFMGICLPLLLGLSLLLALLIQRLPRFQKWVKTGFLLPMAIPAASVVVFFRMLFDKRGWLNQLLCLFGFQTKEWLSSGLAFWVLVFCYIWKNLGYDMILWLAGLQAVGEEQYEAARVQGAGEWMCFWYITLPQLKETVFVTGLLSFVNAFRVFREAYLLAGDYPHESIYMLQHLLNNWFVNLDIQKMTAAAVLLVIVVGGVLCAKKSSTS
ncbi:MAG: sugar ABC transporter permease [Hespellia sp.]|nr:sugar ABC transporter permease [Hespellia sp.]